MNAYDKYHHQQIIYNKINIFIYTYKSFSDMKIFITHFSSHPTITIERDDDCVNILFAIFVANIFFLTLKEIEMYVISKKKSLVQFNSANKVSLLHIYDTKNKNFRRRSSYV
jgi:hypothetical protein